MQILKLTKDKYENIGSLEYNASSQSVEVNSSKDIKDLVHLVFAQVKREVPPKTQFTLLTQKLLSDFQILVTEVSPSK